MLLGLLKWLKETSFYDRKKKIIIKTWTLHERKVHFDKKGRIYDFSDKGKVEIMDFWQVKGDLFQSRKLVER